MRQRLFGLITTMMVSVVYAGAPQHVEPFHKQTPDAASFKFITFMSPTGLSIQPRGIGDSGLVVGHYLMSVGNVTGGKAFVWSREAGVLTLPDIEFSSAAAINACNEIAGTSSQMFGAGENSTEVARAVRWTPARELQFLDELTDTRLELLDSLDINNRGHITGVAFDTDNGRRQIGFLWSRARGAIPIEGFRPEGAPVPAALNDQDVVVGTYFGPLKLGGESVIRAFLWTREGGIRDLGTLGGDSGALDINDRGEVVGYFRDASGAPHAFKWTRATGMVPLDAPGTIGNSEATSVNSFGVSVGDGSPGPGAGAVRALTWPPRASRFALPSDPDSNTNAVAVNDALEITGQILTPTVALGAFWFPRDGVKAHSESINKAACKHDRD